MVRAGLIRWLRGYRPECGCGGTATDLLTTQRDVAAEDVMNRSSPAGLVA